MQIIKIKITNSLCYCSIIITFFKLVFHDYHRVVLIVCHLPASVPFANWEITQTYRPGEFYTGTVVTYTCDDQHSLAWEDNGEIVCGRGGTYDRVFVECLPCEFNF